jgi:hypothetical protein
MKPLEFKQEITSFYSLYNISPVKNSTDIKNLLFCRFYRQICEAAHMPSLCTPTVEKIIGHMCKTIHLWDEFIDDHGMSVGEGYDRIRHFINHDNPDMKESLLKLGLSEKIFDDICISSLERVKDYFLLEKTALENPPDLHMILSLLDKGNCDFEFYNHIIFELLKDDKTILEEFLRDYLMADLIADHITDLEEDIEKHSCNFILLFYQMCLKDKSGYKDLCSRLRMSEDPYQDIVNQKIPPEILQSHSGSGQTVFDWFLNVAEKHIELAGEKVKRLDRKDLKTLFSSYLEGISDGMNIFRKYEYLYWMEKSKRVLYKNLLLKPHPWERISLDDTRVY